MKGRLPGKMEVLRCEAEAVQHDKVILRIFHFAPDVDTDSRLVNAGNSCAGSLEFKRLHCVMRENCGGC